MTSWQCKRCGGWHYNAAFSLAQELTVGREIPTAFGGIKDVCGVARMIDNIIDEAAEAAEGHDGDE
jgi:hypothetical protein